MRCIVVWQFSLYMVFGVLHSISIMGWWRPFSVDAYEMVREFTPSSLLSNSTDNEPPHLRLAAATANGNNEDDSLEEQLKDDQLALKRMVTILTLVGVIGALALIAIIMIFTRMRRRKRRINNKVINAPLDNDDESTTTENGYQQNGADCRSSSGINICDTSTTATDERSVEDAVPAQNDTNVNNISIDLIASSLHSDKNNGQQRRLRATDEPQPSAPPPPSPPPPTTYSPSSTFTAAVDHQRRTLSIPMLQQSVPTPSAPSAKELDYHQQRQQQQEGPGKPNDLHQEQYYQSEATTTTTTSIMNPAIETPPDLPPPAYTPNASPLYDRTYQPSSSNVTSTSTATTTQLTSWRRHSQT